jgi:hypothetical protein
MDIFLAVSAEGMPYLRLMAFDAKHQEHVRKCRLTVEQMEAIRALQDVEKGVKVSPWQAVFEKKFVKKAGGVLRGYQVQGVLRELGFNSPHELAEFKDWMMRERGIKTSMTHGTRRYQGLALRP